MSIDLPQTDGNSLVVAFASSGEVVSPAGHRSVRRGFLALESEMGFGGNLSRGAHSSIWRTGRMPRCRLNGHRDPIQPKL